MKNQQNNSKAGDLPDIIKAAVQVLSIIGSTFVSDRISGRLYGSTILKVF